TVLTRTLNPVLLALNMYDPQLCYILDGFLGVYGLIITGMFIKEKVGGAALFLSFTVEWIHRSTRTDGDYKELPLKKEVCNKLQKKIGLSSATRDTYDSLQMQNLPPR
uniref:T-cell receptor T3 zeta chain n=1 Tax=Amphilophus citrinellus TaxID=61819 RepID=A0A3Q0RU35_AMPCI